MLHPNLDPSTSLRIFIKQLVRVLGSGKSAQFFSVAPNFSRRLASPSYKRPSRGREKTLPRISILSSDPWNFLDGTRIERKR